MCRIEYLFALSTILCFTFVSNAESNEGSRISERMNIITSLKDTNAQNIGVLEALLRDDDPVIRRTSARILIEHFSGNKDKLESIYNNSDSIVSRTALQKLFDNFPEHSLVIAEDALKNRDEIVRHLAISNLASKKPYNPKTIKLLKLAQSDKNPMVKGVAVKALWPFHRDKVLIRDRVDFDYDVAVKATIPVSNDKWLFRRDPNESGHYENWFSLDAGELEWGPIEITSYWQKHGYDYSGVAWYRKSIEIPENLGHLAVELHFDAVCESAWVWVNGKYVGAHDEGSAGWDKEFAVDITDEIEWSQTNIISVRVFSSLPHAGGIWKPVRIEFLGKAL